MRLPGYAPTGTHLSLAKGASPWRRAMGFLTHKSEQSGLVCWLGDILTGLRHSFPGKRPPDGQRLGYPPRCSCICTGIELEARCLLSELFSIGICFGSGTKKPHSCIPESVKCVACRDRLMLFII